MVRGVRPITFQPVGPGNGWMMALVPATMTEPGATSVRGSAHRLTWPGNSTPAIIGAIAAASRLMVSTDEVSASSVASWLSPSSSATPGRSGENSSLTTMGITKSLAPGAGPVSCSPNLATASLTVWASWPWLTDRQSNSTSSDSAPATRFSTPYGRTSSRTSRSLLAPARLDFGVVVGDAQHQG